MTRDGRKSLTVTGGERWPHLDSDFIGGEAAPADPHRLRVAHIDLKEVAGGPVGVVQVLRLGDQSPGVCHCLRHFAVAAATAVGSLRPRRVPPPLPLLAASGTPGSSAAVAERTSTQRGRSPGVREAPPPPLWLPSSEPREETADTPECCAVGPGGPAEAAEERGGTQRNGSGVTGLVVISRFRSDYSAHNAPGERVAVGMRTWCGRTQGCGGGRFQFFCDVLGLERWEERQNWLSAVCNCGAKI